MATTLAVAVAVAVAVAAAATMAAVERAGPAPYCPASPAALMPLAAGMPPYL